MSKTKFVGLSLISFVFAIAGVIISALLLKEDVTSTAHTIFEYFPFKFGVTPASTWEGALILGVFTSVLQVVAASVAFSNKFSLYSRGVALVSLLTSLVFDNWTDVVFRSGNLTGNMEVAFATTLAFYTLGSEITQGLSWLVLIGTWRVAVSDFMWGVAKFQAGLDSIGSEWGRFKHAARSKENTERNASFQNPRGQGRDEPDYHKIPTFPIKNHPTNKFPFKLNEKSSKSEEIRK